MYEHILAYYASLIARLEYPYRHYAREWCINQFIRTQWDMYPDQPSVLDIRS
jgi:hypothetical protein